MRQGQGGGRGGIRRQLEVTEICPSRRVGHFKAPY